MNKTGWFCKKFSALEVNELYVIMQLRSEVFVVEQNCVYLDADGKDEKSYHFFAIEDNNIAAYARILPPGLSFKEACIGRVLTAPLYRRKGLGIILMEKCIEKTQEIFGVNTIKIGGQLYLKSFYENLGFKQCSDEYDEDGIPHIEMIYG